MNGNPVLRRLSAWSLVVLIPAVVLVGCSPKPVAMTASAPSGSTAMAPAGVSLSALVQAPSPDPRVGLGAGLFDAEEAIWNMRLLSATPPPPDFIGVTNSDLAFNDNFAIQGNYNGIQVWDISDPAAPELVTDYVCPASQSDVSVYGDLMFVSGEGLGGRLDCGTQGVQDPVSHERLRGIRIFNIADIRNPQYVSNVQTCRGSHTHSVLKHPGDDENVYVYVSGSAPVRPEEELPGCSGLSPDEDPNSALFRIEVIKVPLAHPEQAAIVSSPRIFDNLIAPPQHGLTAAEQATVDAAKARGAYVAEVFGTEMVLPDAWVKQMMGRFLETRGHAVATAEDSVAFREALPAIMQEIVGDRETTGPTQCHDITLYPELGLAGGACEGYGLLLDISDPENPVRMDAVADSNFSYWHSATFNNDGTKILFSDEWGGGGQPKCRATDPMEWGADALFTIEGGKMKFQGYYKMPAPQTSEENCVAHNGSLIPIPGRDVMVQAWYQGGLSVFDWTDPTNPVEIAFFDRGPADANQMAMGGSWSVYWYNGVIVSSEIARGLDILELVPSPALSANEIAAAKTVRLDYFNTQGQPRFQWPSTDVLAKAYLDQLERSGGLSRDRIASARRALGQGGSGLTRLAADLSEAAATSTDPAKVSRLAGVVRDLASAM